MPSTERIFLLPSGPTVVIVDILWLFSCAIMWGGGRTELPQIYSILCFGRLSRCTATVKADDKSKQYPLAKLCSFLRKMIRPSLSEERRCDQGGRRCIRIRLDGRREPSRNKVSEDFDEVETLASISAATFLKNPHNRTPPLIFMVPERTLSVFINVLHFVATTTQMLKCKWWSSAACPLAFADFFCKG